MSLPDADRSAEGSEPRKERGGLLGALPRVARRRVSSADHEQDLGESSVDGGLRLLQCLLWGREAHRDRPPERGRIATALRAGPDRKSTRLNSSHSQISYAVFCLKKKK